MSLYKLGSIYYRNLPNKDAEHSSKFRSDRLRRKLRFSAHQRWFQIENPTIIKETMSILARYDSNGFHRTKSVALIRGGVLNLQVAVGNFSFFN